MAQWGDELSTPSVLAGLAFGAALMTLLSACVPTPSRTPAQSSRAAADLLVYGVSGTGEKGQLEIDFGTVKIGEHSLREIRVCNAGDVWFHPSDIVFREPAGYSANWAGMWTAATSFPANASSGRISISRRPPSRPTTGLSK
jgi:hypothetical protein